MKSSWNGAFTALIGVLSRAANQIAMIVVTLAATRFLEPADFGIFGLAAAGVTLIRSMLYAGPFEFLLKSSEPERASKACLIINLGLAAVFGVLLIGGAAVAQPLFKSAVLLPVLALLAPSNLIAAFSAWQEAQILQGRRLRPYYAVTVAGEILAAAVAIGLLFAHWGIMALVAQAYTRAIVLAVGYRLLQRPSLDGPVSRDIIVEVLRWSRARYGSIITTFASNYSADFILGALLSPAATGLYRASSRITSAVSDLFVQPTRIICATAFSRRSAKGQTSGDLWPRILLAVSVVGWPALAGLAVIAGELAPVVLGAKWAGAGGVIACLCMAAAGSLLTGVTAPFLVAYNRQALVLKLQLATTAVSICALVLTSRFGVVAAAGCNAAILLLSHLTLFGFAIAQGGMQKGALRRLVTVVGGATVATAAGAALSLASPLVGHLWRLPLAIAIGVAGWLVVVAVARKHVIDGVKALEPT